jgi:hypothetical protein
MSAADWPKRLVEEKPGSHIEFERAVWVAMGMEQRRQRSSILGHQCVAPRRLSQDLLNHQSVDVDQVVLAQVQPQHRQFLVVAPVGCNLTATLHPHDLRHHLGYWLAEMVSLRRLTQIMGHDSLDTTRRYTQGIANDLL